MALFSGAGFGVGLWAVVTAVVTGFVVWHARRVRRDPSLSPVRHADAARPAAGPASRLPAGTAPCWSRSGWPWRR